MLEGVCHCGAVHWRFKGAVEDATICNCTICRRYGVLWAYGHETESVELSGETRIYIRGRWNEFHFCPTCASTVFWYAAFRPQRVGVAIGCFDDKTLQPTQAITGMRGATG